MPKVDASKVEKGERLALFNYYEVVSTDTEYVHAKDENGNSVKIGCGIVENSMCSTTQYQETQKVTRTRLAQIIEGVGHLPFQVCFLKKTDAKSVADALDGADLSTHAKRRKLAKELLDGEERVMHAKLKRSVEDDVEIELGRYKVIDLEQSKPGAPANRLVDTRTVKWLVVDGVKYTV